MITDTDKEHLKRCIKLAETSFLAGHEPFASLIVSGDGTVLAEMQSQVGSGDRTQHPEFNLVRWAAEHMTPVERGKATVYTSCEHCPMCSAAHGWVGLGRIVFACSAKQMAAWRKSELNQVSPVHTLSICDVLHDAVVDGPVPELAEEVLELQRRAFRR